MLEKSGRFEDLSLEKKMKTAGLLSPGSEFCDTQWSRDGWEPQNLSAPNLHIRDTQGL
ncbi:hypothetical protein ACRRTK_015504 [Alexandromys fortis]